MQNMTVHRVKLKGTMTKRAYKTSDATRNTKPDSTNIEHNYVNYSFLQQMLSNRFDTNNSDHWRFNSVFRWSKRNTFSAFMEQELFLKSRCLIEVNEYGIK